jgi:hypothetical protein
MCLVADQRPVITAYGAEWAEVFQGEVYLYERLAPLPRAYTVYAAEYLPDDTQAIHRLLDDNFDLRNAAVTATPLDLPVTTDVPADRAEIISYGRTRIVVDAWAAQDGLLILGDHDYPGWQVSVDDGPATMIRVNHLLRGVRLSPGRHQIVFNFAPAPLRIGGVLSLLGVAGLFLCMVIKFTPAVSPPSN